MAAYNLRSLREKKASNKPTSALASPPSLHETRSRSSAESRLVDAELVLDIVPYPMALWSRDRSVCKFNEPTRELLGFSEDDFHKDTSLWLDRIHPSDRKAFILAWQKLQAGE